MLFTSLGQSRVLRSQIAERYGVLSNSTDLSATSTTRSLIPTPLFHHTLYFVVSIVFPVLRFM